MDTDANDARRKWDRVYAGTSTEPARACQVLKTFSYLLPTSGRALDVACGRGGNALLLAQQGLNTSALDISPVALDALASQAKVYGVAIELIEADTAVYSASEVEKFDVIVVSNYLDRDFCQRLPQLLATGGLLFYQTFVKDKTEPDKGPSNPDFLLDAGELLKLFGALRVLQYVDLGTIGDVSHGLRNQAMLVALQEN